MFARVIQFNVPPGSWETVTVSTSQIHPHLAAQPGFSGVTYYGDEASGEYGCVILWDSVENADAGAAAIRPMLVENLGRKFQGPPSFKLFKVFTP